MKRYAYLWITFGFFLISIGLHWYFGWHAFVEEQSAHGEPVELATYLNEMSRDTFENWQSEFLQLIWQVVGLAFFLYAGSPASKENDDRLEAKIDALLRINAGAPADPLIEEIDRFYFRDAGHAKPHGHEESFHRKVGHDVSHVALRA